MKKFISILTLAVLMIACTDKFEQMNKHSYRVSNKSLEQDFNILGSAFSSVLNNVMGHQVEEDLSFDNWVRHMGTQTNFTSNINNTTYYVRWNSFWSRTYNSLMSPAHNTKKLAIEMNLPVFTSWFELMQVVGVAGLTVYHGPVIYTNYGVPGTSIMYDQEPDLYAAFFKKLDEIHNVFSDNDDNKTIAKFDATYGGDLKKWLKFINTFRLRLAMRIVKADPILAKTQGEKAIKDEYGLILTNADNFMISLYGSQFPVSQIAYDWQDTKMGAGLEEYLLGYNDPRVEKYFEPVGPGVTEANKGTGLTRAELIADHPTKPYKGIAGGATVLAKDDRIDFSMPSLSFRTMTDRPYLTASEVNFILSEAKLRGWDVPKSAREYYEDGVKQSFAFWGAGGADSYLEDFTSTPIDYVDPWDIKILTDKDGKTSQPYKDTPNSYTTRSTMTIKWDDGDTDERKLERIMTQKWIAAFQNAKEMWADHRRTGYPMLSFAKKNDSEAVYGIIRDTDPFPFPLRWPFVQAEWDNNEAGVKDAIQKAGWPAVDGKDTKDQITWRLWIHPDKPNF